MLGGLGGIGQGIRIGPGVLAAARPGRRKAPRRFRWVARGLGGPEVVGPAQQVAGLLMWLRRQVLRLILRRSRRRVAELLGDSRLRPGGGGGAVAGILGAFLGDVAHLGPGRHQFEYAAVALPVAELLGLVAVVAQVTDMQPVTQVVP